jgi:hypothetical protein
VQAVLGAPGEFLDLAGLSFLALAQCGRHLR